MNRPLEKVSIHVFSHSSSHLTVITQIPISREDNGGESAGRTDVHLRLTHCSSSQRVPTHTTLLTPLYSTIPPFDSLTGIIARTAHCGTRIGLSIIYRIILLSSPFSLSLFYYARESYLATAQLGHLPRCPRMAIGPAWPSTSQRRPLASTRTDVCGRYPRWRGGESDGRASGEGGLG